MIRNGGTVQMSEEEYGKIIRTNGLLWNLSKNYDDLKKQFHQKCEECVKIYHADGTYEILDSPEEVIRRRIEFAGQIEHLKLENSALRKAKSRLEKTLIYVLLNLLNIDIESKDAGT